jgi:hypothetical protein
VADLHVTLDALQQDMRDHELQYGSGEVHASRNQAMAVDAITRIDRERAETKPTAPVPVLDAVPPPPRSIERREGVHGSYIVDKSPTDDVRVRSASPAEAWFMTHAIQRLELLITKVESGPLGQPSWRDRVQAVLELRSRVPGLRHLGAHGAADDLENRFTFELMELLEASCATFGDWKTDQPRLAMVG